MASSTARSRTFPAIDIMIDSPLWAGEPKPASIVRQAIVAAATAPDLSADRDVCVVLTDNAAIQKLNRTFRGLDKPTNVLSFPAAPLQGNGRNGRETPRSLGDIVIAYETAAQEAEAEGKPLAYHLAHLVVHGFLHLLGYDHESEEDAQDMELLEAHILARLDLPNPYTKHDAGA